MYAHTQVWLTDLGPKGHHPITIQLNPAERFLRPAYAFSVGSFTDRYLKYMQELIVGLVGS